MVEEKGLLSYNELVALVNSGVVDAVRTVNDQGYDPGTDQVNPASIDLTLGGSYLRELTHLTPGEPMQVVDLSQRESVAWVKGRWDKDALGMYFDLYPGEFILSHTEQKFFMPDNLSGEYSLKSSLARNGLEHMLAGWIDPGFDNSVLTLELRNVTRHHVLRLRPGMPIGQVKFFRHAPVPADRSYRVRGHYNNDPSVSAIKKFKEPV